MKNVVITGSSRGIGYGLAREFLTRGCNVCISGRTEADLDKAAATLRAEAHENARAFAIPCDVADVAQVQGVWDAARREFGTVDIWINNAGYVRTRLSLSQLSPEDMKAMVAANVVGTVNGSQVAVRGMQAQAKERLPGEQHYGGHIYNMMGAGHDGRVYPGMIGYGTTKRAARYFTDSMIAELKGGPVRVGKISPGINVTENTRRNMAALPPEARARAAKPINVLGDKVETTTPWIVDQILADTAHGTHIAWLTRTKVLRRTVTSLFRKRDLFAD